MIMKAVLLSLCCGVQASSLTKALVAEGIVKGEAVTAPISTSPSPEIPIGLDNKSESAPVPELGVPITEPDLPIFNFTVGSPSSSGEKLRRRDTTLQTTNESFLNLLDFDESAKDMTTQTPPPGSTEVSPDSSDDEDSEGYPCIFKIELDEKMPDPTTTN